MYEHVYMLLSIYKNKYKYKYKYNVKYFFIGEVILVIDKYSLYYYITLYY